MTMTDETKLPLTTPNPADDLLAQLRAAAPQIFSEGKIDLDKFKAALGEHIEPRIERYGLNWAGKSDAFRNVQQPSVGTLLPMPDASVDWDSTENLIIEGDNLEVLKLLQKPYHGKVKMIYIDPPYNTGNEFIYPDNFREGLDDYLRYSGQVSEAGIKQSTNTETSGRFHSKWLNMMYPRLFLARNLLRDDGVIFVSIDDNEVHNLRILMNEVFGEENFMANICWQKRYAPSNDTVDFSPTHDFIVVYGKNRRYTDAGKAIALLGKTERTEEQNKMYRNPDNDPRGAWRADNYLCNKTADQRPNLYYAIIHPKTGKEILPNRTAVWRYSQERHEKNVKENRVWWGLEQDNSVPAYKRFLSEVGGIVADTWWQFKDSGHNDEAKKQIKELFPDAHSVFDTPKPPRLIGRMLKLTTNHEDEDLPDIVLDFFAGSGTTGQAVLEQNEADGGNRKFILVQLPEPVGAASSRDDRGQEAAPTRDYSTIADITRERVRRVIRKLQAQPASQNWMVCSREVPAIWAFALSGCRRPTSKYGKPRKCRRKPGGWPSSCSFTRTMLTTSGQPWTSCSS